MLIETAVVGHGRIAFHPAAAQRELRSLELGQRGRVAENGRGHVLRPGDAHARHAARGRPHDVLQIAAVALAAGQAGMVLDNEHDDQAQNMTIGSHEVRLRYDRYVPDLSAPYGLTARHSVGKGIASWMGSVLREIDLYQPVPKSPGVPLGRWPHRYNRQRLTRF